MAGGPQNLSDAEDYQRIPIHKKKSLLKRHPFKEFNHKKFQKILYKEDMENLITMREEALEYRKKAEEEMLQKILENKEELS